MLKRIGLVAVAAVSLSLAASPALADPIGPGKCVPMLPGLAEPGAYPTFGAAYPAFIIGGAALVHGAASLVVGVYTGIATAPALIVQPFGCESSD